MLKTNFYSQNNYNRETKLETDWKNSDLFRKRLKYIPKKFHEVVKNRWEERKLFEQQKRLFNSIKPKPSSGGIDWRAKNLIHKPSIDNPSSLTSEVKRLIVKYFQNTQEWIKEREQKEEAEQEEVKKLISDNYGG